MILMISGSCVDLILDTFGSLGTQFDDFSVYWSFLEIPMYFRVSPETPKVEITGGVGGKLMLQGVQ